MIDQVPLFIILAAIIPIIFGVDSIVTRTTQGRPLQTVISLARRNVNEKVRWRLHYTI